MALTLACLLLAMQASFSKNSSLLYDYSGRWCWEKDSPANVFTLIIDKDSTKYTGGYYSVTDYGNKIDDNEKSFSFKIANVDTIKTTMKSGITGKIGEIQLKILNKDTLEWTVLKKPGGEVYFPQQAILNGCNSKR